MVNMKMEAAKNYTDLLRVEEKRCAMLTLSISSSGKDDAGAQTALSEIKAHCKNISKDFGHLKSEIRIYSSSLLKVEKVVQHLVQTCGNKSKTQNETVQRSFSRDNMIKNLEAMAKSVVHKSSVLYATIHSTLKASHGIGNLFNQAGGKKLLDLLTTKLNLLNQTTFDKIVKNTGLKLAQLSELRDKKYNFVRDHMQLSTIAKTLNETKLIKQKYVQLLKNVQTKKEQISATLENAGAGSIKEKLLRNLTQLHDLKIETERNLQAVSQKLEQRQSMLEAANKRVAASEKVYLAKVSSLVDEANVSPQNHYGPSDIIELISSGGQQNNTLMDQNLFSNFTKFDKKFRDMLKLELSKRGKDLAHLIKKGNELSALVTFIYSLFMRRIAASRIEKPYLKSMKIVTADAEELPKIHANLMRNKLKALLGSGDSSILSVTPEKRLKKRFSSDRRLLFLAFHKAQKEALQARAYYLKAWLQYEIDRSTQELHSFNKVLFHTKMLHLTPSVALIVLKVSHLLSKKEALLFSDSLVKHLLTSPKVLEAAYNVKSENIIVMRAKTLSAAYLNDTLRNMDNIVANASASVSASVSNSSKPHEKIYAYVMGVSVQRQKTVENENNEWYKDNEDRDFFKHTNVLRSLYLKKRLDVLQLQSKVYAALGFHSNSIGKEAEEGAMKLAESYKADEKYKYENELALDKSMKYSEAELTLRKFHHLPETNYKLYMNSSASDKALLDKLFDEKSELKPAKPTSQNNTGADGKMLKNLQNKLRYVQDELNTTMKEKNEAVKKLKMDKTQLSAALMHTTDRLEHQKK
jgi:hypothetical protein